MFNRDKLLKKVEEHINSIFPFLKKGKLLVAVSGGIDSVVATTFLHKLSFDVSVAHCNFKLRGADSDLDEAFVKDWANKNKRSYFVKTFDTDLYAQTNKISIQLAARELRYQWFDTLLNDNNFDYLITAHQADDNLETVLLNLTRGTGFKGLLGIPSQNNKTVRPFLPFTRNEILAYAQKNNIAWREDKSNAALKYSRNKIRHQVIPVLKSLNPQLIETFNKSLVHLKETEQILDDRLDEVKKIVFNTNNVNTFSIDVSKVLELSNPKAYLYEFLNNYGFTAWNDITNLLNAQTGKQILSETHRLIKNRDSLLLSPLDLDKDICLENFYKIKNFNEGLSTSFINLKFEDIAKENFNIEHNNKSVFVDRDKINGELIVRKWQKGDYFHPLGMQGKKKLSDFFKDQKLSLLDKENTWLLCNNQEIIWIIGQRLDNRYKVTEKTKNIIKINHYR